VGASCAQNPRGSTVPGATATQFPIEPVSTQERQAPLQAVLQQTPSAQIAELHSLDAWQGWPAIFLSTGVLPPDPPTDPPVPPPPVPPIAAPPVPAAPLVPALALVPAAPVVPALALVPAAPIVPALPVVPAPPIVPAPPVVPPFPGATDPAPPPSPPVPPSTARLWMGRPQDAAATVSHTSNACRAVCRMAPYRDHDTRAWPQAAELRTSDGASAPVAVGHDER